MEETHSKQQQKQHLITCKSTKGEEDYAGWTLSPEGEQLHKGQVRSMFRSAVKGVRRDSSLREPFRILQGRDRIIFGFGSCVENELRGRHKAGSNPSRK